MANAPVDPTSGPATTSTARPPRLPRWTRQEILVLIEGKRMVERRGRGRVGPGLGQPGPVEPKWAAVSAYCKRHGVNRGPVQCRKRWSNLAGDYKKIKEWERAQRGDANESFWGMRNDLRREKRLPGFFDREVYDILDGDASRIRDGKMEVEEEEEEEEEEKEKGREEEREGEEKVFDGRKKDGLFEDEEEEVEEREGERVDVPAAAAAVAAVPISEKRYEPSQPGSSEPGTSKDKQQAHSEETDLPSQEGHKRRRMAEDERGETDLHMQLIQVLERNSRMVAAQLEAQNINLQLDRDHRKEQTNSLLGVLNKLADALGKIADKL